MLNPADELILQNFVSSLADMCDLQREINTKIRSPIIHSALTSDDIAKQLQLLLSIAGDMRLNIAQAFLERTLENV